MAYRFRRVHRILPRIFSGSGQSSRCGINLFALHLNSLPDECAYTNRTRACQATVSSRFSTTVESSLSQPLPKADVLAFIESALDELEGPCHCWLNKAVGSKKVYRRDGVFLVLSGAFSEDFSLSSQDSANVFEKVKSLQQRYSTLHVIGLQSGSSIFSDAVRNRLVQITMREYITFPILLSNKFFSEVTDGVSLIIFKAFNSPLIFFEKNVDLGTIGKAIKQLNVQHIEKPRLIHNLNSTWVKPVEIINEPRVCSSLRNLLLYFPGCIAVDEGGSRLFLSDTNHHRIIVFDGNGKILDCIGSSPGFEDGEFESAKLMRPAASFYHDGEDCLYIVDSENHAIRRADMESKVIETIYPTCKTKNKSNSLWSWITSKLWKQKVFEAEPEEFNSESFLFPWHLMKSLNGDFFILNRSFGTLWIMDLSSGVVKDVIKGFPRILEICGQMILEKSSPLKQMPSHLLQQSLFANCPLEGVPYAGLVSSVATFQDHVVICDTVGQTVLKLSRKSDLISSIRLSNFGILGLPYWLQFPLERVYSTGDILSGIHADHVQRFSLLPGRVDIQLNVDIPEDTELVEPLHENCIWRQTRGTASEVSQEESRAASAEKVGLAQQFYNDLDSLAFSTPEIESSTEKEQTTSGKVPGGRLCINCAVNTSPGTSEVFISAALYLKLKKSGHKMEEKTARMADVLLLAETGNLRNDPGIQFLSTTNTDLGQLIFMRPLHVRLHIDCRDHPKADNGRDIILTDSSIEVNVALN